MKYPEASVGDIYYFYGIEPRIIIKIENDLITVFTDCGETVGFTRINFWYFYTSWKK